MPTFEFQAPDLTEVNAAMSKAFSQLQGLRMYSEAEIRAIQAAAWFEGWNAGDSDAARQQHSLASSGRPLADDEMSDNPYA